MTGSGAYFCIYYLKAILNIPTQQRAQGKVPSPNRASASASSTHALEVAASLKIEANGYLQTNSTTPTLSIIQAKAKKEARNKCR